MHLRHPLLPVLAALGLAPIAQAGSPERKKPEDISGRLERHFRIGEPGWKGAAPAEGSPSYEEALDALRTLLERHPGGVPDRVAAAPPCVLRIVRAADFEARAPNPTIGLHYSSTWIDLRHVTGIAAEAMGRNPNPDVPTLVATCAFFRGAPEFARWTEVFTLPGKTDPVHRLELADEPGPRICVASSVDPDDLAKPLRQLATLCGGQPTVVSREDVPDSPNIRKGLETMRRVFLAEDITRLERVVAREPNDGEAWGQLGKAYHEAGRLLDAVTAYARALALRPADPAVLFARGMLYRTMGWSEEALGSFHEALEADPRQLESLLNVGLVHAYDLRQPEEAASAWAKLHALDPRSELAARARWEIGKLGDRYARGDGMPQDWARANALFERSCDLGEVRAFTDLAISYALGRGVPVDPARVDAIRRRVCDLGDERACGTEK